jgi:hypothetical protein
MKDLPSPSSYFKQDARSPRRGGNHLVSVRLPDELVRRLATAGNDEGLSMSDTIRLVLERGLAAQERKRT